jgi:ribonuclease VapC
LTSLIVVDSSALVSVLLGEPDNQKIFTAIVDANERQISAFSVLESNIIALSRKGRTGQLDLEALLQELDLTSVPFDAEQGQIARQAWNRFGKGRHPAALNIGDCCSYALARSVGAPLLCKGNDFPQTDLDLVPY